MISDYFTDEELISQLRMFFTDEEQEQLNFQAYLGQLEELDLDTWKLTIKGRLFRISKIFCEVEEVET